MLADVEAWAKKNRGERIRRAARELSFPFQIDFVTEAGFPEYLARVEKQVSAVRTADWLIPEPPKPESAGKS